MSTLIIVDPTDTVLDPTDTVLNTRGYTHRSIREECGLLISWALQRNPDISIKETLIGAYGYGVYEMTGSTVDDQGVHSYPEDPDLYPLISITDTETSEIVYVYQFGIVAFTHPSTDPDKATFVTRMD